MRQEHKLCAEVYHYLYDFIDHDRSVHFCLDGEAAKRGGNEGLFADPLVPDLWFTFSGAGKPLRIEAKILDNRGRVRFCGNLRQPKKWSRQGDGQYKPHLWIAANGDMNAFWLWGHDCFEDRLANGPNAKGDMKAPDCREEFPDAKSLALGILEFARREGFLPGQRGAQ